MVDRYRCEVVQRVSKLKKLDSTAGLELSTLCLDHSRVSSDLNWIIIDTILQERLTFEIHEPRAELKACTGLTNSTNPYIPLTIYVF